MMPSEKGSRLSTSSSSASPPSVSICLLVIMLKPVMNSLRRCLRRGERDAAHTFFLYSAMAPRLGFIWELLVSKVIILLMMTLGLEISSRSAAVMFDFVAVLRERRLDLLDAQPDAEGLLLHGVLLLPQDLDLLQHLLVLLLHLRERGLEDETKRGARRQPQVTSGRPFYTLEHH
ncbi:hypothetical protein EYF80_009374 [Liparis tanakae]|uniref:Uncharacterized protein n=1 Tax=Liparis tanakae TaxID=230148 RepID=A0A4Z2IQS9_9TELE|nr:hypothetical protein EYF80_009374 [Liparis tanakae]